MMLGSSNAAVDHPTSNVTAFIRRANSIMRQLSSATLHKFVVKFPLLRGDADHLDRWVSLSAASRARRIVLDLCPEVEKFGDKNQMYSFPLHLFTGGSCVGGNPCVKSLYLGFVSLNLLPLAAGGSTTTSGFTNLKQLTLHKVSIVGDLQSLLPECAVLEWLSLTYCSLHCHDLIIRQPLEQLRYLRVLQCRLQKLQLQAPNLTEFEFTNQQVPLVLGDCINMSMASVELLLLSDDFDYICTKLPVALPHVRDRLTVGTAIRTEALVLTKAGAVFANLRHLILNVTIHGCPQASTGVLRLAYLLDLAPVLEELELHMYCVSAPGFPRNPRDLDAMATSPPARLHERLRIVHMTGFHGSRGQLELAHRILWSTAALDRLIMIIGPRIKVDYYFRNLTFADTGRLVARRYIQDQFPGTVITVL
ncbi:hypothetical protein E2562_018190 [Oryza meyeriana var. granulata]|uniref:At1g61320/AtMIF1 LRR domain-containing protein n=1 Tax=Oryza meyeriana var. granulata TaxID=110450 RepID=A0A6G1C5Z5_9ORYZ|nr:hypothetical protein E2562_018190 [Oryza meyeriana var. granulata]